MRASFAIVVTALVCATLAAPAGAASDPSPVSTHTHRSTAFVTARVNDHAEAVGSGVILSIAPSVIVLTARHLAERKNLALKTYSGETLRIVAEYEVADRDLALLIANGPCTGCEAAQTADVIKVGQPIHVWGNPQGRPYVLSPGTIVDLRPAIPGFETNGRFALACDSCDVGDSGAGVFDAQGRLLGIVTEGWDGLNAADKRVIAEPANQALAHVPLEYVHSGTRTSTNWPGALSPDRLALTDAAFSTCIVATNVAAEVTAAVMNTRQPPRLPAPQQLARASKRAAWRVMQSCSRGAP